MASENDQLLEQLKEMVEGFKGVGQYAKDLSSAISASTRPLQQLNDMTKAIGEQMASVSQNTLAMAEGVKKMSSEAMAAVTNLKEMAQAQVEAKKTAQEQSDAMADARRKVVELRAEKLQMDVEEKKAWREIRDEQSAAHEAQKSMQGAWAKTIENVKQYQLEIAKAGYITDEQGVTRKAPGLGAALQRQRASMMSTGSEMLLGQNDAAGAVKSIGSAVAGLAQTAGVGGLIGMMIYGKVKEAEFKAVGETAAQAFDQLGGHSANFAGRMGAAARELSVRSMAAKEDLAQVAQAFASTGVNATTAEKGIKGFSSIVGNDLIVATLAADKALELPAGSFAKLSGSLARDFNTSADKAFVSLMNIAAGAKQAGMNAALMLQQVMETASGLRMLNANADAVAQTQLRLAETMKKRGFGEAYAQSYTAGGMQNAAGAIGGMGEGLSAIIGERLGYGSGLDALYAMKTGSGQSARGMEQLDMAKIMKEMRNVVQGDMGLTNRSEQAFALQKVFGVDTAGADAILDAMDEANSTNKLSAKAQEELNKAFMTEGQKTNQIMKHLEVIKDGIAHVMTGLLGMIINGLKMLTNVVMYGISSLVATFQESRFGGNDKVGAAKTREEAAKYWNNVERGVKASGAATDAMAKGIGQLGEGVGGILEEFELDRGWPWNDPVQDSKRRKAAAARVAAAQKKSEAKRQEQADTGGGGATTQTSTSRSEVVGHNGRTVIEHTSRVAEHRPDTGAKGYQGHN